MEALFAGPSLQGGGGADGSSSEPEGPDGGAPRGASPPPPPPLLAPPGYVLWFAYGSSIHYESLARDGVKPASRDGAMLLDTSVRVRFKHRGGASASATLSRQRGA